MRPCIYALCRIHPPKHTVSTTPPKRHGFSRYRCADIEVLMCWYWSIDVLIHSHVNACLHKPQGSHSQSIMSNMPPKDMSSIHSKCIDEFISCYIYIWIHFSEELQTLSKTLTRIPCIDERSLAYSAFQFRLAATGPEKRLALFQFTSTAFWHKEG